MDETETLPLIAAEHEGSLLPESMEMADVLDNEQKPEDSDPESGSGEIQVRCDEPQEGRTIPIPQSISLAVLEAIERPDDWSEHSSCCDEDEEWAGEEEDPMEDDQPCFYATQMELKRRVDPAEIPDGPDPNPEKLNWEEPKDSCTRIDEKRSPPKESADTSMEGVTAQEEACCVPRRDPDQDNAPPRCKVRKKVDMEIPQPPQDPLSEVRNGEEMEILEIKNAPPLAPRPLPENVLIPPCKEPPDREKRAAEAIDQDPSRVEDTIQEGQIPLEETPGELLVGADEPPDPGGLFPPTSHQPPLPNGVEGPDLDPVPTPAWPSTKTPFRDKDSRPGSGVTPREEEPPTEEFSLTRKSAQSNQLEVAMAMAQASQSNRHPWTLPPLDVAVGRQLLYERRKRKLNLPSGPLGLEETRRTSPVSSGPPPPSDPRAEVPPDPGGTTAPLTQPKESLPECSLQVYEGFCATDRLMLPDLPELPPEPGESVESPEGANPPEEPEPKPPDPVEDAMDKAESKPPDLPGGNRGTKPVRGAHPMLLWALLVSIAAEGAGGMSNAEGELELKLPEDTEEVLELNPPEDAVEEPEPKPPDPPEEAIAEPTYAAEKPLSLRDYVCN